MCIYICVYLYIYTTTTHTTTTTTITFGLAAFGLLKWFRRSLRAACSWQPGATIRQEAKMRAAAMCIVLQSRAHAARRSARFLPSTRRWRRSHSRCRFPRRRRSPSSTLVAGSRRSAYRMASTCNNKAARTSGSTAETKGSSGMGLASGGRKAQRLGCLRNAARTSSAGSGQKHVVLGRQASHSPTLHTAHGGQFWWGCHARHLMMTGLPTCAQR